MTQAKTQLDALTGMRGIAAWMVVLYHVRSAFSENVPQGLIDVFAKGYLAVDLFFVLSGFVMWLNYGAKFQAQGFRAAPDFLIKRIARIYPLHFVILLAMVAFSIAVSAKGGEISAHYPWGELPLHFLLIQNWGFTDQLMWNDPAWSISTELGAYLMLPLVAVPLFRNDWSTPASFFAILALVGALGSFFIARGAETLGHGIVHNGLFRCIVEFLIGVFVCMVWKQASPAATIGAALMLLSAITLWSVGLATEHFAVPALCAAAVYLLAQSSKFPRNPLASRALVYVGDISYSTYLVHFFLWVLFKLLFVEDRHNVGAPLMIGFFATTFVASALLYRFVEEPGRAWVQRLADWLRTARIPARQGA